jgi:hypothetical protein
MALQEIKFAPGVDKQDTAVGAVGRWVESDNIRFRYGLPEKVGGWQSLLTESLVGVTRKMHAFVDNDGNRYVAMGTDKFLIIYFEGQFFDITPLKTTLAAATFSTTAGSPICTFTTGTNHGLSIGDIVLLDAVTVPVGTGYVDADFEGKLFQVITVPSLTTFTVNQSTNAVATVATGGSVGVTPYEQVGPAAQTYGYGWGVGDWGGVDGTTWGNAVSASSVTLEPGLWSLSNFGEVLVATIANGKTFTWNSGIAARLSTKASTNTTDFLTTNNPTATRDTLISPTTRHLIHFGTETTIGDATTQDDMFIRFSVNEQINVYDVLATNTAGTFRLQDGTKIMGAIKAKENILVWTDNALYTMKFVGAPFTFGFEQVGTNCGLIGKNSAIEIDGVAYWMSNNGFFSFDGTVNTLACSVEDYVYDNFDTTKGQQVNAGINNLFTEVTWWYPSQGSEFNDRYVVFNYGENNAQVPMGNWYTGININSIRTTWIDSLVYPRPYATTYNDSLTGTFPVVVGETGLGQSVFFEQEVGTDQVNPDGSTTALTSLLESFDFALQTDQGIGEYFLAMRRFLPNFKNLVGNVIITVSLADYPSDPNTTSALSPFTITSTTSKIDTRARGRYGSIKIQNTGSGQTWRFGTFQADLQPDGRR